MEDAATNEVIFLISKYVIRRAFKVFAPEARLAELKRIVASLYLTSKHLKNSICDELWLEVMHRWMKGRDRCALISKRMELFLQNNDKDGMLKFMGVVVKVFKKRESVHLLRNYLIKITRSHTHMLEEYISFFIQRTLHMKMPEYRQQVRDFPFLGFKPEHVEKAMQIAYESGNKKAAILLLHHFVAYYLSSNENESTLENAMLKDHLLIFNVGIAYKVYRGVHYTDQWLEEYWGEWQTPNGNLDEVLFDMTQTDAAEKLQEYGMRNCSIISFQGSRLVKYCFRRAHKANLRYIDAVTLPPTRTQFRALLQPYGPCLTRYIYDYYRAVVTNDIETAKRIQTENGITLFKLRNHPHPLKEYMENAEPKKHVVEYLLENFDSIQDCLSGYWPLDVSSELLDILKLLTSKGAKIFSFRLWKCFYDDKVPRSVPEFRKILDVASNDRNVRSSILSFLFDNVRRDMHGNINDMNMIVLLAWKYGDKSSYFSTLPKEILQLIFGFMNEPLFYQYARVLMEHPVARLERRDPSGNEYVARFYRDYLKDLELPWRPFLEFPMKSLKRDAKYIEEIFIGVNRLLFCRFTNPPFNVAKFFVKHSTNEKVWKYLIDLSKKVNAEFPLLEYAAAVKNTKLLQLFYKESNHSNRLPNQEIYDQIQRKNKISFEEALEIAELARQNVKK